MERLFLGLTQRDPTSRMRPVYFDPEARALTSGLIVGAPGSGKSKFQEWMLRGDILHNQRDRCGPALIDFHGSLFSDIEAFCAYHHFLDTRQVIILNPSEGDFVVGFNPFLPRPGLAFDVQVSSMVDALLRVWGQENTNQTPTLERVLKLVFSAMLIKQMPIHDAHYLLNFGERDVRGEVIRHITQPIVQAAWVELQAIKTRREWHDEVLSTENRLFRLITSDTIRRFMGGTNPAHNLDLKEVMDQGKILLVNLKPSAKLSRDNAHAFGALLLNDLFKVATALRSTPPPNHYYVYIDEWQNAITPDLKFILSETRKYGLHLYLSNQEFSQIPEDILNSVLTCCQMKACFGGLTRRDARLMAENMLVGQLDLNEEKFVLEATKFWPKYQRDKVYTRGSVDGWSSGGGDARSSSSGWSVSGDYFDPRDSSSYFTSTGSSTSSSSCSSHADVEMVADIPILMPEPFTEVSQRATYSLEEQIWRWTDRLMASYQRHCFLKLPYEQTIPLLVPFVPPIRLSASALTRYQENAAKRSHALPALDVDRMLETEQHARLKQLVPADDGEDVIGRG